MVDNALISGETRRFVIDSTTIVSVWYPLPEVKYVTTKSSSENVNAIKNPDKMPGIICGTTALKNDFIGGQPRSSDAS